MWKVIEKTLHPIKTFDVFNYFTGSHELPSIVALAIRTIQNGIFSVQLTFTHVQFYVFASCTHFMFSGSIH